MLPLISIVINNYNYGRYVDAAILSALQQTYAAIEVVVVDDGSTDDSREIIRRHVDRILFIEKSNGGQASAFNAGIERANGRFIMLLDADDYLYPTAAAECVQSFPDGYARIYFQMHTVDGDGNQLPNDGGRIPFVDFDGDALAAVARGERFPATVTSANFFDAVCLRRVLPVPEREWRLCADNFVSVRTAGFGLVRSIRKTLGAYRIHGSNGWMPSKSIYTDDCRLGVYLDSHLRGASLIEEMCRQGGMALRRRVLGDDFWLLHLLCAARGIRAKSVPRFVPGRISLLLAIGRYLFRGTGSAVARVANSMYLVCVLTMPKPAAKSVLELRAARKKH